MAAPAGDAVADGGGTGAATGAAPGARFPFPALRPLPVGGVSGGSGAEVVTMFIGRSPGQAAPCYGHSHPFPRVPAVAAGTKCRAIIPASRTRWEKRRP